MDDARQPFVTAIGTALDPHLLRPDTRYNVDGVWKVKLILEAADAAREKERIDALVEAAIESELEKLPPADQRKAQRYYPYAPEEDADGNPTGRLIFDAKQNARIKLRDPDPHTGLMHKDIKIDIFDHANQPVVGVEIGAGSRLRLIVNPRPVLIKVMRPFRIGVQLSLYQVQVIKLVHGGVGPSGFDAVPPE